MRFKTSIIKETIELEQDGEVVKTIPFTFDASRKWAEVNRYRFKMAENKNSYENIGKLFMEMLQYCLNDAADELLAYYEGNWEGMINDIAPLFTEVIFPACEKAHKNAINALKKAKKRG